VKRGNGGKRIIVVRSDKFIPFLCYMENLDQFAADRVMEFEKRPLRGPARDRFKALLKLASESPFEGERENAMAAANRLAEQHGMSLDEAARPTQRHSEIKREQSDAPQDGFPASEFTNQFDVSEQNLRVDKARREAALRDAIARGLDKTRREGREKTARRRPPQKTSQRSPRNHAQVLLAETAFSLQEIVGLTGLDIYEVVGLKLKMRSVA